MPRFRNQPVDVVLDVRTRVEYWMGHLPDAVQISVDDLERRLPEHPEIAVDRHILVYCASGARSAMAAGILRRLGYRNVTDAGGIGDARAGFDAE